MATAVIPGEIVMAYCGPCKKVATHQVAAVRGSRPYSVQCAKCEDVHRYRASAPATKKKSSAAAHPLRNAAGDWIYDDVMKGRDPALALTYGMNFRYAPADLIAHETFGLGLVTRVLFSHKIEVVFPDGTKTLVHER